MSLAELLSALFQLVGFWLFIALLGNVDAWELVGVTLQPAKLACQEGNCFLVMRRKERAGYGDQVAVFVYRGIA